MGNTMLLMLAVGGRIDPARLQTLIQRGNERRRKIFTKGADIIFGLVMFFWGDLDIKVQLADGKVLDATDPSVSLNDKINAMLAALKAENKGTLLRELVRPFLITAAEVISDLMAPDELLMSLVSGGAMGGAGMLPAAPSGPLGQYVSDPRANMNGGQGSTTVGNKTVHYNYLPPKDSLNEFGWDGQNFTGRIPNKGDTVTGRGPIQGWYYDWSIGNNGAWVEPGR